MLVLSNNVCWVQRWCACVLAYVRVCLLVLCLHWQWDCCLLALAAKLLFAYAGSGLFKRCRKRRVPLRGRRNGVSLLRFPDRVRVLFLQ